MDGLKTDFQGERGDLFALAIRASALTVATAGLYVFWKRTKLRRWYWSAVRPGGMPLEYTGTPSEKLMGFLVAVIVLAIYLAGLNLVGLWIAAGVSAGAPMTLWGALAVPALAVLPLIFIARYRARAYILSRSSWLGIRFGMRGGAWGYAWRACMYWALTILTLGLLWPLMTFQLEKYLTDRSFFGDARFQQFGNARHLLGPILPFWMGLYGTIAVIVMGAFGADDSYALLLLITIPCLLLGALYYRVASVRVLTIFKELGEGMEFDINPRTRSLLWIWIKGVVVMWLLISLVSPTILGLVVGALYALGQVSAEAIFNPPPNVAAVMALLTWITVYVLFSSFREVFITQPMLRHVAETLVIEEPVLLRSVRQRDRDAARDAGGLSAALDMGAAF